MADSRLWQRRAVASKRLAKARVVTSIPFVPVEAAQAAERSVEVITKQHALLERLVSPDDEPVASVGPG